MSNEGQVREALLDLLRAADDVNDPTGSAEGDQLTAHNEKRQGEILAAWEKLAFLTGNEELARSRGFNPTGDGFQKQS